PRQAWSLLLAFRAFGRRLMATAFLGPVDPVVLGVVHDLQDIDAMQAVIDASDQAESVVAHIEDGAVADLVRRAQGLPEGPEVGPKGLPGDLVPDREITTGDGRVDLEALPERPKTGL